MYYSIKTLSGKLPYVVLSLSKHDTGAALRQAQGDRGYSCTYAKVFRRKRFLKFFSFTATLFSLVVMAGFTPTEGKRNTLLRQLDAAYYYPQRTGLDRLSVMVSWLQGSATDPEKNNPAAIYHYDSTVGKRRFQLTGHSALVSADEQKSLLEFFNRYGEMIIPRPLEKQFAHLPGRIASAQKSNFLLQFQQPDRSDFINRYDLWVNLREKQINQIRLHRSVAPRKILSSFKYARKDDRWIVSKSTASYEVSGDSIRETTEFFYRQVGSLWLVGKIRQIIEKNGRPYQEINLGLDRYKIDLK